MYRHICKSAIGTMSSHAIILTVLFAFGNKGVESLDEATYISGVLSTAVCSSIDSYSESRTLKHPQRDQADGSNPATKGLFQRNECGGKNCDPKFSFTPVDTKAGGRIPVFGPQSQVNFSITAVGAYKDKLYVYVAEPHLAWPLALAACISNGMQLVDVDDLEEMNKLADIIWSHDQKQNLIKVWTGGHRFTENRKQRDMEWYALGKVIPINTMWVTGRPKIEKGKDCVQMDNEETRAGFKLRDVDCKDNILPFMCETML